jgi:hypothetical protein
MWLGRHGLPGGDGDWRHSVAILPWSLARVWPLQAAPRAHHGAGCPLGLAAAVVGLHALSKSTKDGLHAIKPGSHRRYIRVSPLPIAAVQHPGSRWVP